MGGKSWEEGLSPSMRATLGATFRRFSFVPDVPIPAGSGDTPGRLEDQVIHRHEGGRWVPLEGRHVVINVVERSFPAGRRTYVLELSEGPFVVKDQAEPEAS